MTAYQDERLPATREIVLRNRVGRPEMVIDPAELEAIVKSYAAASVATPTSRS